MSSLLSRAPLIHGPHQFVVGAVSDCQRDFSPLLELLDDAALLRRREAAADDGLAHGGQLEESFAQQQRLGLQPLVLVVAVAAARAAAPQARGRGLTVTVAVGVGAIGRCRCCPARLIGEKHADGLALHHETDGRALQSLALLLLRAVAGDQTSLAQALKQKEKAQRDSGLDENE